MQRIPLPLLCSVLIACGASPSPDEETTPPIGAGDEAATAPPVADDALLVSDPCAEGLGEPCAEDQGLDGGVGEITDGGVAEGDAEALAGGEAEEPQMSWRNMVGAGRVVFDRVCGVCHPEGEEDIGPDIRRRRVPVARLRHIIRHGTGRMRPIPQRKLPDRYMDELMAYLTTLGTVSGVQRPEAR